MKMKEQEYQLCQLCRALFKIESLRPIKIRGGGLIDICHQCILMADSRSKLPKKN